MTFLRGRPWLVPCLVVIFLGGMQLVTPSDASHPTLAVVCGLIAVISGGLMLFLLSVDTESATTPRPGPQASTLPLGSRQPPGKADVSFPLRRTRTSAARPVTDRLTRQR